MSINFDELGDISEEFFGSELGDFRLNERLGKIVDAVAARPSEGFPEAFGSESAREAMYRFLANDSVSAERLLEPHIRATVERLVAAGSGIIIHDTSTFCFSGDKKREGLCKITRDKQGFYGHFALAASSGELNHPLGLIGFQTFTRTGDKKRRPSEKIVDDPSRESLRWLNLVKQSEERILGRSRPIHLMDRQADFYELFDLFIRNKYRFIVRMAHDRRLAESEEYEKAFAKIENAEQQCERMVPLSPRKKSAALGSKLAHPPRNYRLARLAFSATNIDAPAPRHLLKRCESKIKLNIVHVYELDVPEGLEPVNWKLVTSESIENKEQILDIVDNYRKRWLIEEYFKAIKTGCSYEKRQLESYTTLLNALAISIPIAWRILLLRSVSREKADTPASAVLTDTQIKIFKARLKEKFPVEPSARDALMAVASLGGHIKNNGDPGWIVLWRGYRKLLMLEEGWLLYTATCDQS